MFPQAAARTTRRIALSALLVLGVATSSAAAAPPDTRIDSGPSTIRTEQEFGEQPFRFSSSSPDVIRLECRLDGGGFSTCGGGPSGVLYLQSPADGTHTFEVRAVSWNGVEEETDGTPAKATFRVAIPPETFLQGGGQTGPNSISVAFGSNDTGARFECSLDGASFTACASPMNLTNVPPGAHTFAVRAVDASGNTDASPVSMNFTSFAPPPPMGGGPIYPPGVYPPGVMPPNFIPARPPVGRPGRVQSAGLTILSGPGVEADGVEARVMSRSAGTLRMTVAPKAAPETIIATGEQSLAAASRGGRSQATIKATFTPEGKALLAKMAGRLPVVVTLTFTAAGVPTPVTEQRSLTLLQAPVFAKSSGGRRYAGGYGVERIRGTAGGDVLGGASGNDRIMGLAGNDRLTGGTGNDTLMGGPGNDSTDGTDGDDRHFGGPGDDMLVEERFGDDFLDGGAGNDWIVGGRGVDKLKGGPGDDVLYGGSGPDTMDCGPGNDVVFINLRSERQRLKGCEEVHEEGDIVSVRCPTEGSDAPETMLGSESDDTCRGGGGDDDVEGAGGHDKLYGGGGNDRMFGRFGRDSMFGEGGDDELEGGRDDDLLDGGAGNDQLNGGYGNDVVRGGGGDDRIIARSGGRDTIDCGPGRDTVVADRKDKLKNCEKIKRS